MGEFFFFVWLNQLLLQPFICMGGGLHREWDRGRYSRNKRKALATGGARRTGGPGEQGSQENRGARRTGEPGEQGGQENRGARGGGGGQENRGARRTGEPGEQGGQENRGTRRTGGPGE